MGVKKTAPCGAAFLFALHDAGGFPKLLHLSSIFPGEYADFTQCFLHLLDGRCNGDGFGLSGEIHEPEQKITINHNCTISGTYLSLKKITISNGCTLTLNVTTSSSAIENNGTLKSTSGVIAITVTNKATIESGTFRGTVNNEGTIKDGTFSCCNVNNNQRTVGSAIFTVNVLQEIVPPKTGNAAPLALWLLLCLSSAFMLTTFVRRRQH